MAIRARDNFYSPIDVYDDQPDSASSDYAAGSPRKLPSRLTVSSLVTYFKENRSKLAPLIILAAVNAIILLLVLIYHTPILSLLQDLGNYLKTLGPS